MESYCFKNRAGKTCSDSPTAENPPPNTSVVPNLRRTRGKREMLLCFIIFLLLFPFTLWLIVKEKEKKALVDETGIETIGTVIKKSYGKIDINSPMLDYDVSFDFVHEKTYCARFGFSITEKVYDRVIVGRKYKVKYLLESPVKTAQIYLDEPIYSEDINIKKECERILKTYK